MKVMHIAECAGGVDIYLKSLLPRLTAKGIEQIFVCSHEFKPEEYEHSVDAVYQVEMAHSVAPDKALKSINNVRKLIKETKPDIVYCHSSFAGVFGRVAAIGTKATVVYNPHGWAFDMKVGSKARLMYRLIERMLAPATDRYVNISEAERISATRNHITRPEKIKVIYNGIDFSPMEDAPINRSQLGIPEDAYVLGMVGRISKQKAPDVFIRVGAELRKSIPNLWMVIVGDGDEHQQLSELARELSVADRLVITGWVDNPQAYLPIFNQAVLLSRWEGFGLVLPEYAKAHLPIVASKVGAIGEVIEDTKSGLLVEPDNVEEATLKILELYNDPQMRKDMIEYGYKRSSEMFNIERVVDEHLSLFDALNKHIY